MEVTASLRAALEETGHIVLISGDITLIKFLANTKILELKSQFIERTIRTIIYCAICATDNLSRNFRNRLPNAPVR